MSASKIRLSPNVPTKCAVTGGSGFVGQRLVEMLVERGATRVVSFDISPKPRGAIDDAKVEYICGDITNINDVKKALHGVDIVFHLAALVGPYHPLDTYMKVNYNGSVNILEACKELGIKRIVMSSSPSTRFPYPNPDVDGLTEDDLYRINGGDYAPKFLQPYAESKAKGEEVVRKACGVKNSDLLTIAVAPHQVYGPRDTLFLPNILETAGSGRLRIFGAGLNRISFCHVDNYCHGLILGADALHEGSPALGKFYVITDGPPQVFWKVLDVAIIAMGFRSLWSKFHLPTFFMLGLSYLVVCIGNIISILTNTPKHVVNYRLVLNPFVVKMVTVNRYFDISAAKRDLKYEPLIHFDQGWPQTIEWFKNNWLPTYLEKKKSK